jgi:hypothetical protein
MVFLHGNQTVNHTSYSGSGNGRIILQTELESVTMKEMFGLSADDKFNSVSRHFMASGHNLSGNAKKAQLMKILPAVYTDCVTVANSQA